MEVGLPDLAFTSIATFIHKYKDEQVRFTVTWSNKGTIATQAYKVKCQVMDKENNVVYEDPFSRWDFPSFLPGLTFSHSSLIPPDTLDPGYYTVIFKFIYDHPELRKDNNTISDTFTIEPPEVQTGQIRITTDDEYDLYVDSTSLGGPVKLGQDRNRGSWERAEFYNFPQGVGPDDEILIAVKGNNLTLIAGLLLDANMPDGTHIYTNDSGLCVGEWVCSTVYEDGWNTLNHDDNHWLPVKKYADYGSHTEPHSFHNWGNKPYEMSNTQADWIWEPSGCVHPDSMQKISSLPIGSVTVYFRYRIPKPDLIVEDFRIDPVTVKEGNISTAYFKIKNQGGGYAPASLAAIYVENTTNSLPQLNNNTRLATKTVPHLGPGQITGTLSVTLGPVSPVGTYKVVVKADDGQPATANGDIPESNETNNLSTVKNLTVTGIPELGEYDIRITTINKYEIHVHAQGMTYPTELTGPGSNNWKQADSYNFPTGIGPNDPLVIAVRGERLGNTPDTLKGLMLDANMPDGTYKYTNGEEWVYSLIEEPGWNRVNFNDSHWLPVAGYGDITRHSPFPIGMQNTSAHWIWAGESDSKIVYFRYSHGDPPPVSLEPDLTIIPNVEFPDSDGLALTSVGKKMTKSREIYEIPLGESIRVWTGVKNIGTGDAGASTLGLYVMSSEKEKESTPVRALVSGQKDDNLNIDWTPEHAGEYQLYVMADSRGVITETEPDKSHNKSKFVTLKVKDKKTRPQIIITYPSAFSKGPKDLIIIYKTTQDGDVTLSLDSPERIIYEKLSVTANVLYYAQCENLPVGEHHIRATISNNNGTGSCDILYEVIPSQNNPPKANASATPTEVAADSEVQFLSTGTSDEDGDDLTYKWDFGDGNTSTQPNPSHTYNYAATYTVKLTVADGKGGSDSKTIEVTVNSTQSQLPEIEITSHKNGDVVSGTITIKVNAQSDAAGIDKVKFLVDEAEITTDSDEPYEVSYDTTSLTNDMHTFKTIAYDTLGQSAADSVTVEVDNDEETWLDRVLDRKRISEEEFDKMKNCDDVSKRTWKDITYKQFSSVEYPEDLKEQIRQSLDMLKGIAVSGNKFGDLQKIIDHIILSGNSLGTTGHGYPDIRAVSIGVGTWDFSEKYWESRSFSEMDKINFAGCFVHEATHVENKNILKITHVAKNEQRALFIGYLWSEKILAKNGKSASVQCPNYIEVEHFSDNNYDNAFVDAHIHGNSTAKIYIDKLKNAQKNSILTASHEIYGDFSTGWSKIYYTLKGSWPNITQHSRKISTSKYDFDGLPDKKAWEFEFDVNDRNADHESIIAFSTIDPESIDGEGGEKANRYYVGTKAGYDTELYMLDVYSGNRIMVASYINNLHPEIDPILDQSMKEEEVLRVSIEARDEDGNALTLSSPNLPGFASMPEEYIIGIGADIVFKPTDIDAGMYEDITVIVEDEGGLTAEESFDLEVINLNNPPELDPIGDRDILTGDSLNFSVSATDPDGDELTYSAEDLPDAATFEDNIFSWTPADAQVGTHTVIFSVSDGELIDSKEITITVSMPPTRPPEIESIPDQEMNEGDELTVNINTLDLPDNEMYSMHAENLPKFAEEVMLDNRNGPKALTAIIFRPGYEDSKTYPDITVVLSMGKLRVEEKFTLTVKNTNRPPEVAINNISPNPALPGQKILFNATITDPDGKSDIDSIKWYFGDGNSIEGALAFHSYNTVGDYTVTLEVKDKSGVSVKDQAKITVASPPDQAPSKPILDDAQPTGSTGLSVNENQLMKFKLSSYDPDGTDVVYLKVEGPGSINKYTGIFTWQTGYTDSGTYPLKVKASSNGKDSEVAEFTLNVQNTNRNPKVSISSIYPRTRWVGEPIIFTATITDDDGKSDISYIRWDFGDGKSTTGGLSHKTRIHTYDTPGTYAVTVETKDRSGSPAIKAEDEITVKDINRAPILTEIGDKTVAERSLLSFSLSATDPNGDALTYSAQDLPDGATFNGNTFSWTPTYAQAEVGPYKVTFKVRDDGGLTDSEDVTITVQDKLPLAGDVDLDDKVLMHDASLVAQYVEGLINLSPTQIYAADVTRNGQVTHLDANFIAMHAMGIGPKLPVENRAPSFTQIGNKTVLVGSTLTFTISATDPDGNNLTYSLKNPPDGATLKGNTFSWTPLSAQKVTFEVTDGELTSSKTIIITVQSKKLPSLK